MAAPARKFGSEQEFDEVADWRGFQDLRLPASVDGLASPALDSWTARGFGRAAFMARQELHFKFPRRACDPAGTSSFYEVDRFSSPSTAPLPEFDAQRLARVPGGDGTAVVPNVAESRTLGKCQPRGVSAAGSQRGVDCCTTLSALAPGYPAAGSRPTTREQRFTKTQ